MINPHLPNSTCKSENQTKADYIRRLKRNNPKKKAIPRVKKGYLFMKVLR